ncbi:Hsp70 family protein [Aspergillus brunneoviolaceus CBS 621.78]|uniref:Uncharacterized protein n=1 Tax=Aspergillus brunneoviolaceus CBS 621.78 TaxID=1450534 RepID=A0ACD1G0R3_9EURO|nr:hypothetical protein BO95DRAFT_445576 [Aspergillus brunneoviolaceus CBS 621.78]RAH42839.1 hypothetical protein BO95DRAFT_445576 [Aspergillus brunneoviolaceus CBS 621.78]
MDTQDILTPPGGQPRALTPAWSNGDTEPVFESTRKQASPQDKSRFIVGIDFGTTTTSVAYCKLAAGQRPLRVPNDEIKCIRQWPYAGEYQNSALVPSESLYSDDDFSWGYRVRDQLMAAHYDDAPGVHDASSRAIRFAKLLFVDEERLEEQFLQEQKNTIANLHTSVFDVVKDYLRPILWHTIDTLRDAEEDFDDTSEVELSVAVPVGCSFISSVALETILTDLVEESQLESNLDLYLIHEPEAASSFLIDTLLRPDELSVEGAFMVCDAGGGTVDVITYTVLQEKPLRLKEIVPPAGASCGSVYVNQAMEQDLTERLRDVKLCQGIIREREIERMFQDFENRLKRNCNLAQDRLDGYEYLDLPGLKADPERGFKTGAVAIPRRTLKEYFKKSLEGTASLIQGQLDSAGRKGYVVKKVLMIGGLSQSKPLRQFLKERFASLRLKFIFPTESEAGTLVSRGCVYRAIDKSNGPHRQIIANIGYTQSEEYDPKCAAHRAVRPEFQILVRQRYVYNCINWIFKKGDIMNQSQWIVGNFHQVFEPDESLIVNHTLYYSEQDDAEDHYPESHPKNEGCVPIGTVVADLDVLRDQGLIRPATRYKRNTVPTLRIHYELHIAVSGRSIRFSVVYPPGSQKERGSTQVSIAASFEPSTM